MNLQERVIYRKKSCSVDASLSLLKLFFRCNSRSCSSAVTAVAVLIHTRTAFLVFNTSCLLCDTNSVIQIMDVSFLQYRIKTAGIVLVIERKPPLRKSHYHFLVENDTQYSETNEKSTFRF